MKYWGLKSFIFYIATIGSLNPLNAQSVDSVLNFALNLKHSIADTEVNVTCMGSVSKDDSGHKQCGIFNKNYNKYKAGKWIFYNDTGKPDSISYFNDIGDDTISFSLSPLNNKIISVYKFGWRLKQRNVFSDLGINLKSTWNATSDTTSFEVFYYPSGNVRKISSYYNPDAGEWFEGLLASEIRLKNGTWYYFADNGKIEKEEKYDYDDLLAVWEPEKKWTYNKITADTITKLKMQLSAFGVESDDFPSIDVYIDFTHDSSGCRKRFYNPAFKDSTYTFDKNELKNLLSLLTSTNLRKLPKDYTFGPTDQPSSITIIDFFGK